MSSCVLSDFFLQRVQGARLRCLVSVVIVCTLCLCFTVAGCKGKKHKTLSGRATKEVVADKDAWVWEYVPTTNYGDDVDLSAGHSYGSEVDIYLHFDLSSIPSTATVVSAQLWLYVSETFNWYHTGYSLEDVDVAWG